MNETLAVAAKPIHSERLQPKPLPENIRCTQPGGGWMVRVELAWGRLRRGLLRTFRTGYVRSDDGAAARRVSRLLA